MNAGSKMGIWISKIGAHQKEENEDAHQKKNEQKKCKLRGIKDN